jgi:Fur family iron response transcriptional regulator
MLRARGIYPTAQRLTIANLLFASYQHLTAGDLHRMLVRNGSDIAKATVYNTLGLFVKMGLLREVLVNGEETFYDTNPTPHHHIYNLDTGELSDLPNSEAIVMNDISLPYGLMLDRVEVVVRVRENRA